MWGFPDWVREPSFFYFLFFFLSGNTRIEMSRKLKFYTVYGVQEYYVYDPDHNKTETLLLSKPNGEPFVSYLELVEYHEQAIEALSENRKLLKQEQEKLKLEQGKLKQEQTRVKNSVKAFQALGLPNVEIATILGLTLEELEIYLIQR